MNFTHEIIILKKKTSRSSSGFIWKKINNSCLLNHTTMIAQNLISFKLDSIQLKKVDKLKKINIVNFLKWKLNLARSCTVKFTRNSFVFNLDCYLNRVTTIAQCFVPLKLATVSSFVSSKSFELTKAKNGQCGSRLHYDQVLGVI